ncbi:hypothetical protein HY990_04030 [Candidatus Micrarchaeota archaeon]|nr:hypothetical protein [Candidatus Micrarchaeota archaeon]
MSKRKIKRKESDFVLDLEHNALSSLLHGIKHYVDALALLNARFSIPHKLITDNFKFAIIHVFHSVELFLKAKLAEAHPLLIYSKPENEINEDAHTVGFEALLGRLSNLGVKFTKEDRGNINALRKMRNSIEHHKIQKDIEDVKLYVGRAARFLEKFLEGELDITLKEEILEEDSEEGEETYKILSVAIQSYEERLQNAKEEMESFLPVDIKDRFTDYEIISCDTCEEETIIIPDDRYEDNRTKCFFCGEEYYYEHCTRCGLPVLSYKPLEDGDCNPCSDCWHEIMSRD